MSSTSETINQWLRDAHAAERQAETMLSTAVDRVRDYPELSARISEHLEETRQQRSSLERCLEKRGASTSTMKDMAGKMSATMQGMFQAMSEDEVVKTVLFSYAFEQMEIASYRILVTACALEGDHETRQVCSDILDQEIAMAAWLEGHSDEITTAYLSGFNQRSVSSYA
jgi:ferritin-like metal-binding protein YciE